MCLGIWLWGTRISTWLVPATMANLLACSSYHSKELVSVVLASALWRLCTGQQISFRSDNMAVVALLKSSTSHAPLPMHTLRCLAFYSAYYRFQWQQCTCIPGILITAADATSSISLPYPSLASLSQLQMPPVRFHYPTRRCTVSNRICSLPFPLYWCLGCALLLMCH